MHHPREILFQILCVAASLLLLVMSLLYGVRITALNQQAAAVKASAEALRQENEILRVRAAGVWSLEEIERRAREELGMQSLSAEQIVRTDFAG
jgi:cell division protein FtsB